MSGLVKQLTVFLSNKQGELEKLTDVLMKNKISIKSLVLPDTSEFALVRLIVDDAEHTKEVLKQNAFSAKISDVIGFKIEDKVGSFNRVLHELAKKGTDILYTYMVHDKESRVGIFILSVKEVQVQQTFSVLKSLDVNVIDHNHFQKQFFGC